MIRQIIRYTAYFVFLIFIQILVLNNINFAGKINPYLFVVFILSLPFSLSKAWVLFLGFFMGLIIDIFVHTPGINAAALVFMGFSRNLILPFLAPRDGFETGSNPSASEYGWGWYLRYALILVSIHHIFLFFLDAFSFANFGSILLDCMYSIIFTMLLIILTQSNRSNKKSVSE